MTFNDQLRAEARAAGRSDAEIDAYLESEEAATAQGPAENETGMLEAAVRGGVPFYDELSQRSVRRAHD